MHNEYVNVYENRFSSLSVTFTNQVVRQNTGGSETQKFDKHYHLAFRNQWAETHLHGADFPFVP